MSSAPAGSGIPGARVLLIAIAPAILTLASPGFAQNPKPATNEEGKTKFVFSPEGEAKFAEFVKKVAEAKRNLWELRMKKEITAVAKITGLDAMGVKALEIPAQQAAALAMEGWTVKFEEYFRRAYSRQPEQIVELLDQIIPQAENYATANYVADYAPPTEQAPWIEGLRSVLSADQATKWTEVQGERERRLRTEIGAFLKPNIARTREQLEPAIQMKSAEMKLALALPKERADRIDALAKAVVDASAEEWGKRAERVLLSMEDQQRAQVMKTGHFYLAPETKELPAQRAAWKAGLTELLSDEERARLKKIAAERRQRQWAVIGQLMMAELDEKIAFSATQRQRLQPLIERLAKDQPGLVAEEDSDTFVTFSPQTFLLAAARATEEELEPFLEPVQRKRWQEVCTEKKASRPRPIVKSGTDKKTSEPPPDPEVFELTLSDFLHEKAAKERKRLLGTMMVKAEDVARAAQLSPETFARLQTAARGATEELLATWNAGLDSTIRSQLREATPETIKQRLASVQDYYFQRSGVSSQSQPVWESTVKKELTPEQQSAWQKEVDERAAYRAKAIVAAILAEFDRRNTLTVEQWTKLEPVIAKVLKEYGPDIGNMFSYANSSPWYLQQHTMLMVFAGVPDNELKPILTAEQWDQWTKSDAFTNSRSYWENVQSNHAQRVKRGQ